MSCVSELENQIQLITLLISRRQADESRTIATLSNLTLAEIFMITPLIIQQSTNLPSAKQLLKLLETNEKIEIKYQKINASYISGLTFNLPDHSVFNREWDKTIFITRSINNDRILEKKAEFYECARAFRHDALNLMQQMSLKFGIDLNTLDGFIIF